MKKPRSSREEYILIFNATTLIVLRELNRLDIIEKLRRTCRVRVVIPQSVKNEFLRAGVELNVPSDEVTIESVNVLPIDIPRSLGEGERHAIALAYTLTRELSEDNVIIIVVTDDKRARKKCRELRIRVFGTLGLIEFAKKRGVVSKEEALELLKRIPDTSLYITPELLEEALAKVRHQ